MRALKFHEQKLLKKVDFYSWKDDANVREAKIIRKYHLQNREDYQKYNRMVGMVTKLVSKIKVLNKDDEIRSKISVQLLNKLYNMGLISKESSLIAAEKLTVSAFCRRRLPVVMVRLKMSENLKEAITLIEQGNYIYILQTIYSNLLCIFLGHVRVGPHVVTDPSFLVTRTLEDYVTWLDSSKIKRVIMQYNDKVDDFDLLGN